MSENNELMERVNILFETIRRSVDVLLGAPVVFAPILIGTFIVTVLNFALYFTVDPFDWWWIGDLSYYSLTTIMLSFVQVFVFAVIFNLTGLATLDMAQKVILELDFSIEDSFRQLTTRLVDYAIIGLLSQIMVYTYLLIPLCITIMVVASVENIGFMTIISRTIEYVQSNLVDMVLLSVFWLLSRFILVQIPYGLSIQIIPDLVVGVSALILYLEKKHITLL
jgi:hypothetical protein